MSLDQKIGIFTTTMRTEFIDAYTATAEEEPWQSFTQTIPSNARIEHYTWMSPTPGLALYQGHRRFGKIESVRYSIENLEFDSSFEALIRDIRDDQTGGYSIKAAELGERAKKFPGRRALKNLSQAKTLLAFDGLAVAASSRTGGIGTGANLQTYTSTGSADSATYKMAFLYTGAKLKPLLWQNRMGPDFETDSGSPGSKMAKKVRYWVDMELEVAFGYWWNIVWVDVTNTPSVVDMHGIFALAERTFRTFQLPKALNSEDGEYIHEGNVFSDKNLWVVSGTALADQLRQGLRESMTPQTIGGGQNITAGNVQAQTVGGVNNRFMGFANYCVSAFMN